jgi:hypothetical protein
MFGTRKFGEPFKAYSLRKQRVVAAVALLLGLALPCFDVHAELLFRSIEQIDGQQRWSPIRKYINPSDTAYARVSASGTAVEADEVRVFLSGVITRADVDSAEVLGSLLKSGKHKITGNTVWLASDGGDIDAAMELGRLLRKWGVFTHIGKNDQCFSACVFAFMGGERRSVAGRLGIHRPYFPYTQDSPDRPLRFRHLQTMLKGYVEEMDFPASLYEAVMLVPPESMQILGPADLKRFYLEGISPSSEDLADAASARRLDLSMYEYLQYKAKTSACALPVADPRRCEGIVQDATANGGAADVPGSMQNGETAAAGRAVTRGTGDTQHTGNSRGITRATPGPS